MMIYIGAFIFTNTFNNGWRHSTLLICTLMYTAFVILRSIGFVLESLPSIG